MGLKAFIVGVRATLNGMSLVLGYFTTKDALLELGKLHDGVGNLPRDVGILCVIALVLWMNRHVMPRETAVKEGESEPTQRVPEGFFVANRLCCGSTGGFFLHSVIEYAMDRPGRPLAQRAVGDFPATIYHVMGRDHWPQRQSVLMAGGGMEGGCVIGATDHIFLRKTKG